LPVLNAAILLIAEFSRGDDPDKNAGCHRDNDPAVVKITMAATSFYFGHLFGLA
jgi:hypothetical protein